METNTKNNYETKVEMIIYNEKMPSGFTSAIIKKKLISLTLTQKNEKNIFEDAPPIQDPSFSNTHSMRLHTKFLRCCFSKVRLDVEIKAFSMHT